MHKETSENASTQKTDTGTQTGRQTDTNTRAQSPPHTTPSSIDEPHSGIVRKKAYTAHVLHYSTSHAAPPPPPQASGVGGRMGGGGRGGMIDLQAYRVVREGEGGSEGRREETHTHIRSRARPVQHGWPHGRQSCPSPAPSQPPPQQATEEAEATAAATPPLIRTFV